MNTERNNPKSEIQQKNQRQKHGDKRELPNSANLSFTLFSSLIFDESNPMFSFSCNQYRSTLYQQFPACVRFALIPPHGRNSRQIARSA